MITEALSWFRSLVDDARTVQVVDLSEMEDSGLYGIYDRAKGTLDLRHPEAPLKRFIAHDMGSLVALVNGHMSGSEKQNAIVFVGSVRIEALLNVDGKNRRRESIRFPLTETPEYEFLKFHVPGHTQSEFVRLLRVKLHRANVSELLGKVSHLKFQKGQDGESIVSQGTQSLTRQVTEQLGAKDGPLPETVVLDVLQFEELYGLSNAPSKVTCAVEVDPTDDQPLHLVPLGGELEKLEADAREFLVEALVRAFDGVGDNVMVVAGDPCRMLAT